MSEAAEVIGGRFELIERIGGGAFGEVWRGRDQRSREPVALKRIHPHVAEPAALLRFTREANMLARVDSPYVVRYVEHGRDAAGRPWLATEWIDGEDLSVWQQRPEATLDEALALVRDAALGIAALHAAGVVHRDLKPANIIVAPRPGGGTAARVVDLGIAHLIDGTVLTQAGTILGSPAYMAPEQVRGEPIDERVDLWALGVLLFELAAGEPPFGSSNAIAVLGKVLLEPVPPLTALRQHLPLGLESLVERLLEKAPERRMRSAHAVATALEMLLRQDAGDLDTAVGLASRSVRALGRVPSPEAPGERRLVALLFASGGDASGEFRAPDVIERCGGRAEPLRDAWLGGFGLSRARGDELIAAAEAARELARLGARVGLVTGWAEVRAGSVIAGQLIDRGAALLDRAAAGEIRVQGDAVAQLADAFAFERASGDDHLLVRARGRSSMRPAGAPPLLLGRSVPALGRDKELRLLEGVWLEAVDERAARLALVVGEAGLGKSRLRYEITERLRASATPPGMALCLRGEPMLADVPHALVVKGLREAAGLEEGEEPEAARAKLRAFAAAWLGGGGADAEILAELLRVPQAQDDSPAMRNARQDPALMQQRVREALRALLRGMAAGAPLLLAVEDVHWADRATVDLLGWLLEALRDEPVVCLAFARPEVFDRHPSLWPGVARTELRLAPLSQRVSEQLIASVLRVGDDERRAIAARAGGNPLFLEELVRARAEGVQEMPIAVQAALQVRLDALGLDARRLAQAASVFGQTFWAEGVAALRPASDVTARLDELIRAEVIVARQSSRFAQATEYAFGHVLVRDAAYAMLIDAERCELHARAAAWLERMGESDPAVIGHHYAAGARGEDAARHFTRAAHKALRESAYEGAAAYATRALACHAEGDAAAATLLLRAEVRRALGHSHAMLEDARAAEAQAQDPALQIEARSRVAQALRVLGQLGEADATLRAVLEESHATLLASRIQALLELAMVDLEAGRGAEAGALIDEALSWLADAGPGFEYQRLLALRARVVAFAACGDLGRALDAAQLAVEQSDAAGHRARAAEARAARGRVLALVGRTAEALRVLAEAEAEARALRLPLVEAHAEHFRGVALAVEGDLARALEAHERAGAIGERIGVRSLVLSARAYRLMHTLELGGDPAAALAEALALRGSVEAYGPLRCGVEAMLARAHLLAGRPAEAVEASTRAIADLRALGSLDDLEEYVRLTHAEVLAAAGREADAASVLYQARERLMRKAAKLRDPADRGSFCEAVAVNRRLLALADERLAARR